MDEGKQSVQDLQAPFGYSFGTEREDHCLIDVGMVAIPSLQQDSVASPISIFDEEGCRRFSSSFLGKPKIEWSSRAALESKPIYCGVKRGQYPQLVKILLRENMATLLRTSDPMIDNSVFGVWKNPNTSQRLIWAGNRSNQLFRDEASFVEIPVPDLLSSMFLKEINSFIWPSVTFLSTTTASRRLSILYRSWASRDLAPHPSTLNLPLGLWCLISPNPNGRYVRGCRRSVRDKRSLDWRWLPVPSSFNHMLNARLSSKSNVVIPYIDDITEFWTSAARFNHPRDEA